MEVAMIRSHLGKMFVVALGFGLLAIPSAPMAQSRSGHELVNRPYWSGYGQVTNYDREVNGSDASTPGHN
jgi:hypothetical protein